MNLKGVCVDEMKGDKTSIGDGRHVSTSINKPSRHKATFMIGNSVAREMELSLISRKDRDEERIWVTCVAENRRCGMRHCRQNKEENNTTMRQHLDEQAR